MNNNAWIIWNELTKTDYKIDSITINICNSNSSLWYNLLEIKVKFEFFDDVNMFSNKIFKKYGIDIHVDTYNYSFDVELKKSQYNMLDNLKFPSNVNSIKILSCIIVCNESNVIKLFNLPENLCQLKIISLYQLFDLSNIPTNLILLDISECEQKINLDYLPEGLKILYLPEIKNNKPTNYIINDLSNLPSSLIEINIGTIIFVSTKDLMKTFNEKVFKDH